MRHNEEELKLELSPLFSQDRFLLETYRNPWSEMRFGKILENLSENITFMSLIVAARVDKIRLRRRPNNQYLSGKVTWVGSSSMEIRMRIL